MKNSTASAKCWLNRTPILLLAWLTGCANAPASDLCPEPIAPSECVIDWIAGLDGHAPRCALHWMNQVEKQQIMLERGG